MHFPVVVIVVNIVHSMLCIGVPIFVFTILELNKFSMDSSIFCISFPKSLTPTSEHNTSTLVIDLRNQKQAYSTSTAFLCLTIIVPASLSWISELTSPALLHFGQQFFFLMPHVKNRPNFNSSTTTFKYSKLELRTTILPKSWIYKHILTTRSAT